MNLDVLAAQLVALRAQVDAMYQAVQAAKSLDGGAPADEAPIGCRHLETENMGTFGAPEYRCKACGALVEG